MRPIIEVCTKRVVLSIVLLMGSSTGVFSAWALLDITGHDKPDVIATDTNPTLRALIACDDDRTCIRRVCFRVTRHPEAAKLAAATRAGDYCVDMSREASSGDCGFLAEEEFVGLLPMPEEGTEVTYYFTTEENGEIDRSEDFTVAAKPLGGPPQPPAEITVYLTKADAPETPPGFKPLGIIKFVPAGLTVAAAVSIGGGVNTGLIAGVTAAVAGAATGGVVASSGPNSAPGPGNPTVDMPGPGPRGGGATLPPPVTSPPPGPPPPVTPPAAPRACFGATPTPPTVFVGDQIRLDASCSTPRGTLTYVWALGDGRVKQGTQARVVNPIYPTAGTYTVTLTAFNAAGTDSTAMQVNVVDPPPPLPLPPLKSYVLSGSPSPTQTIFIDDVLTVSVAGSLIGTFDPMGTGGQTPPIPFTARAGDALRIVALDLGGGGYGLSSIWLHPQGGSAFQLTAGDPGCSPSPCGPPMNPFFDGTFILP